MITVYKIKIPCRICGRQQEHLLEIETEVSTGEVLHVGVITVRTDGTDRLPTPAQNTPHNAKNGG